MRDLELTLGGHEKFLKLCALYPTGSLSGPELASLREHLETCETCRTLVAEYGFLNRNVMPLVIEEHRHGQVSATGWEQEAEKRRLFEALDNSEDETSDAEINAPRADPLASLHGSGIRSRLPVSIPVMAFAALFVIALIGGVSYFVGLRKGTERSARQAALRQSQPDSRSALPGLVAEQKSLDAQIKERDAKIEAFSAKIAEQSNQIARLNELLNAATGDDQQARSELSSAQAEQSSTAQNRDAIAAQLKDAQIGLVALQAQLGQTLDQRTSDLMQTATLQRRIDQLDAALNEKESQVQEQQTLLSSDRDIRDLMGARDLFIADVFDIDRDGKTKKPFGRVFYTKNKSLVFYAFDLDKQPHPRSQDVTFQAWGVNDADKHRPVSLGIFYMDNQVNRRWVLKFDDPAVLERINAVFVTLEPSGGSSKPSGKQLLYAYLEAQPNHP